MAAPNAPGWRRYLRFWGSDVVADVDDELEFHVEERIDQLIARGVPPDVARDEVLRTLGDIERIKQLCRAIAVEQEKTMRRAEIFGAFRQDARFALRVMRANPVVTAAIVLTLALGIGATTSIFSVIHGVLLKPLPFHEPDRLVALYHRAPGVNLPVVNQGPATYFTYRDNQRAFEDIGAWFSGEVSITARGDPERVEALAVTDGTLPLLRVQPFLGRLFNREDDSPGSPVRVVLTYGYWQRTFGGARDVIGQGLEIDGRPAEIVGVLPASFKFLDADPAVLLPLQLDRANANGLSFGFQALARLRPGVTLQAANADIARMIPFLDPIPGFAAARLEPNVYPLAEALVEAGADIGDVARILWILFGAVGIVLVIACANVANLFLVRAEGRHQEFAVRAALGASRGRITRALLTESLVLGLAGGGIGLLFAGGGIGVLRRLAPATLPRVEEIGIEPVVLLFTLGVSILTSFFFGLVPALRFGKPNAAALKQGSRTAGDGPSRQRVRNLLVVAEVAMALVLLIVSGLMIRTSLAMRQVEPGFVRPEEVQTFRVAVPAALVDDRVQMARTHDQIAQRLRQVPGVVSVGLSSHITMDGENNRNPLIMEHVLVAEGELPPLRRFKTVAPGFFETMGSRLVAGRGITWADIYDVRPVVVISESLAREYWREPAEALGKRVQCCNFDMPLHEIVGVVSNERDDGVDRPATAIVYWPLLNTSYQRRTMAYAVRSTRVGTPGFLRELQQAVWSVNPNLPLANVRTLEEIQADSMARTSFAMVMLAIAASVALLLGIVGIYGVLSYVAAQRTREIGLRMALGAQIGNVRRLFLRRGLVLASAGIVLGIVASMAATRVMSTLLFGVGRMDPITYAAVSAGLMAVALLATWVPARRASGIDPIIALRADA